MKSYFLTAIILSSAVVVSMPTFAGCKALGKGNGLANGNASEVARSHVGASRVGNNGKGNGGEGFNLDVDIGTTPVTVSNVSCAQTADEDTGGAVNIFVNGSYLTTVQGGEVDPGYSPQP